MPQWNTCCGTFLRDKQLKSAKKSVKIYYIFFMGGGI